MENIKTKVPGSRRGKYVVIGLLAAICVLSFHIYREHKLKTELIRQKAFLLGKLRDSRRLESTTTTKLDEMTQRFVNKKEQLTAKGKEIEEWKNKLDELTNSYNRRLHEVVSLKESATKSQDNLGMLKKQYLNASSTIEIMKDKLEKTLKVCESTKGDSETLRASIKDKEVELNDCTTEKGTLQNDKQDLTEKLNRLQAKLTASQRRSVATKAVNDNINRVKSSKTTNPLVTSTASRVTALPGSLFVPTTDDMSKLIAVASQSGAFTSQYGAPTRSRPRAGMESLSSENPTTSEIISPDTAEQ